MKKKLVMKKWVEVVLFIITLICVFICVSECDDTFIFAITHIFAGVIIMFIAMLFNAYGRRDN